VFSKKSHFCVIVDLSADIINCSIAEFNVNTCYLNCVYISYTSYLCESFIWDNLS